MAPRKIVFKANNWEMAREEEDEEQFYVTGLTKDDKSVMVKVLGFTPFVNVELPPKVTQKGQVAMLFEFIKEKFAKIEDTQPDSHVKPPVSFKFGNKYNLYHKKPGRYMTIVFPTQASCRRLQYFFGNKQDIPGVGSFEKNAFKVHEQNIDQIIKFTATRDLKLGSWIEATEYISEEDEELTPDERRFSRADIDMCAQYTDLKSATVPDSIHPRAKIASFDLECYSVNPNSKLPDPTIKGNEVFQISVILARDGDPEDKWKNHLLTIRKGADIKIPNALCHHFKTEKQLLIGFTKFIKKENPDIMIGYNILKFDWDYLIQRANLLGIYLKFAKLGRLKGQLANNVKKKWTSSAYGDQVFEFLECQGRLNIDVLPEVERNHKLDQYSLDFVSEKFLEEHKRPVSAKQLFKLYKFAGLTENYHNYKITPDFLRDIKKIAEYVFDDEEGITKEYAEEVQNATQKSIKRTLRKTLEIIGDYCIYDSVLVMKLIFKMNILFNLEQMANIFCVPISYLQTRGQQVKVLAQVYRYTLYNNIIIPFKGYTDQDEEKYEGAMVVDAVPGFWKDVATLDFASLYPTVMISNNIDYTTYVDPTNDNVPDEECNVIEFESHRGCKHDTQERKTKVAKENILCGHYRHKFKKVVEKDGKKYNEGVLPYLLRNLLAARKVEKGKMKEIASKLKDESLSEEERKNLQLQYTVVDAKQLAIKVSANSMYGAMGARTGFMPLIPGAASTTAQGRHYIKKAIHYILTHFDNAKLVYGDSVAKDTPILVRDEKGNVDVVSIEDLGKEWKYFTSFKPEHLEPLRQEDEDILNLYDEEKWKDHIHIENLAARLAMNRTKRIDKQYSLTPYEVWTDEGWKKIKKVIRHKVNKNMYRVNTHNGVVDVTEDHSLLDEQKRKVKPGNLKIGDRLLHSFPESISPISSESQNPKIQAMIDYCFMKQIHDNVQIYFDGKKYEIKADVCSSNEVKKIIPLGQTDEYVYDLETENGRFQAGIGSMIVKNTDSCMIKFQGVDTKKAFELAERAAKECTALFPKPVELEFECIYGLYFLLTKKRYIAYMINKEMKVIDIIKKGVVLKRRDNTHYLKNVYGKLTDSIMKEMKEEQIFYDLYDDIQKLFTLQVEPKDLVIYKGIKDLISYAKTTEIDDPNGSKDKNGKVVKLKCYIGHDKKPLVDASGKPLPIFDSLDPRLVYDHTAHLMLAQKMKARGDDVPPNTRLQYVFLDKENTTLQGEKAEDYTFFRENKHRLRLRLDPLYYLEKQLIKPVTEVIDVLYRTEKYTYESLETRINRCEEFIFRNTGEDIQESILVMREHIIYKFDSEPKALDPKKKQLDIYENRSSYAKYISATKKKLERFKKPSLLENFDQLIQLYFKKKSELLLDKIEKRFGLKKRRGKKPDRKTGMLVKDGTIMKDIFEYRSNYQNVVQHIKYMSRNIEFYD